MYEYIGLVVDDGAPFQDVGNIGINILSSHLLSYFTGLLLR